MTYIDYMKQLWKAAETEPIPASEIALYALLVNECNRRFWKTPFPCTSIQICEMLRMSKQTLNTARQHLSAIGLISYVKGKARFSPSKYCILDLTDKLTDDLTINKNKGKDSTNETVATDWLAVKDELSADEKWLNATVKFLCSKGQPVTVEILGKLLYKFFEYIELTHDTQKTVNEARKHFVNWAAKQHLATKHTSKAAENLILKDGSLNKYAKMKERVQ